MPNMVSWFALAGSVVVLLIICCFAYHEIKDLHSIFKRLGALDDKEAIKREE